MKTQTRKAKIQKMDQGKISTIRLLYGALNFAHDYSKGVQSSLEFEAVGAIEVISGITSRRCRFAVH